MHGNEYQVKALETAVYPQIGENLVYPVLGLTGEAGEVAEKVKKVIRDEDGILTDSSRDAIALELSDVVWYVAVLAHELDYTLDEIFEMNLNKLSSRSKRGTLKGNGDNR
jgi:NTP pyrophosphatase (non-canonical NTP hydrolase)